MDEQEVKQIIGGAWFRRRDGKRECAIWKYGAQDMARTLEAVAKRLRHAAEFEEDFSDVGHVPSGEKINEMLGRIEDAKKKRDGAQKSLQEMGYGD